MADQKNEKHRRFEQDYPWRGASLGPYRSCGFADMFLASQSSALMFKSDVTTYKYKQLNQTVKSSPRCWRVLKAHCTMTGPTATESLQTGQLIPTLPQGGVQSRQYACTGARTIRVIKHLLQIASLTQEHGIALLADWQFWHVSQKISMQTAQCAESFFFWFLSLLFLSFLSFRSCLRLALRPEGMWCSVVFAT